MKRGQLDLPFHWIYILLAGVVIMLFFIGVVVKQKASSEKEISFTILTKLQGIFAGAALSDHTLNVVDIPHTRISFFCSEDGSASYQVGDQGFSSELPSQPFFTSSLIDGSTLVLWTLDFSLPFYVTNFLFLNSPSQSIIVIYDDTSPELKDQIERDVPSQFHLSFVPFPQFIASFSPSTPRVKLVFLTDPPPVLPASVQQISDNSVHAVKLTQTAASFYRKQGARLEYEAAVPLVRSFSEKDAAFYGALFSDDSTFYRCMMGKAFRRLSILSDIYQQRTERIIASYPPVDLCALQSDPHLFAALRERSLSCTPLFQDSCAGITSVGQTISEQNDHMQRSNCPALY